MKYNVQKEIQDFKGAVLLEDGKPITFQDILFVSLSNNYEDDAKKTGDQKMKRFLLVEKIAKHKDGLLDLSIDEIAMCKEFCDKLRSILLLGRMKEFFENPSPDLSKVDGGKTAA